ncbi:MAG TPA: hypothetical protein DCP02_00500, partial [Actinobacteria bacterium]|nr:hypothetical protein [Actinomycetota bacterium]
VEEAVVEEAAEGEPVTLEFASWRTEDIALWDSMLANFTAIYPNITINFQPTKNTEYDVQLTSALETGVGPDIMFLRSFDGGEAIYDAGYLAELADEVPALADLPDAAINAWATDDGVIYGVPMAGVTHGVFYSTAIFEQYGLTEPATWAEFLDVCQTLKDNGETVIAQGTNDRWDLYEVMYSGLGANFYGGEASRQALVAGEAKMTDDGFVAAFAAMDQLQPYFPDGYEAIDYVGMQQLFGTGQAAMYIGGSWEISTFEGLGMTADDVGWFAPPVENAGDTLSYCFHVDYGVGVNKDSENLDAAIALANWLATPEFAAIMMEETPGFFSYVPGDYTISNALASEMIAAASGADVTIRTTWEKLMSGVPSGYDLMTEAMWGLLTDEFTAEQAAAHVQDGLDQWYGPFQD